ncbi:MAG: DUF5683 domain-containing protein [bacterium]
MNNILWGVILFILPLSMTIGATDSFAKELGVKDKIFPWELNNPQEDQWQRLTLPRELSLNDASPDMKTIYNPGKALLLSAILPGAGQYYAGLNWTAVAFFTIEVMAWGGAIYFHNRGIDKEKEFKRFADTHFNEDLYRQKEYELAINPQYGDSGAFRGEYDDWIRKPWEYRIHFLPHQGFTHDLPLPEVRQKNRSEEQQYYEMIGKYIRQFGFGWDDKFGDDPNTPYFDGRSIHSERYMDIRFESNQMLERSTISVQVAMLNHIASALHASFSVRAMNRKVTAQVGFRTGNYDQKALILSGLYVRW